MEKSAVLLWLKEEETPTRVQVCSRKEDMKRFEETEDCFILDFDPYDSNKKNHQFDVAQDVCIVSEKGQVACRDYPHPRHLCLKFPFTTTPHKSYCEMCYCCVCDEAAPCKHWTRFTFPHCDAADRDECYEGSEYALIIERTRGI